MKRSFVVPVLLLVICGLALGGMQYLMWKQTHEEEVIDPVEEELSKIQAKAKKATKEPGRTAVVETSKGTIKFVLYEKDVPKTTAQIVKLAEQKFYDGSDFHRVEDGFVIQGGQPRGGKKRPPSVMLELADGLHHDMGAVGLARTDALDSGDCEFYITLANHNTLDNRYCVFGKVIEGMDVAHKIKVGDKIKSVRIVETPPEVVKRLKASEANAHKGHSHEGHSHEGHSHGH